MKIRQQRRKLPWYEYLSGMAGSLVAIQLSGLLGGLGLGILITLVGALGGGFVAFCLAYELAKRLSERFPALKSEHVGYFD